MGQISIRLDDQRIAKLDKETEEKGYDSRANYVRTVLNSRHEPTEVQRELDECQSELNELQAEVERLHRERRQLLEQRDEHTELVRYAQDQREDEQRRREIKQHNVFRRAWWWVAGEPTSEIDN
jgi:predicted nuclease with TOPRIM domain